MSTIAPDPTSIPITPVPPATPTAVDQAQTTIAAAAEQIPKYLDVVKQAIALEKQLQGDAGKIHPKIKAAGIVAAVVLACEAAAQVLLGLDVSPLVYGVAASVSPVVAGYLKSS